MTLLRSVGNSKVPLVSMVLSAIANIVLDLLFVFPLHMGVFGAALATVLAQAISALYCFRHILRASELLPQKGDWKADGKILAALTGKGLPVAVMNSVTAIGGMVLQVFVNQMGTAYVAAYAACMKVCGLFEQPGVTVGLALLTFTGQNYGAKKYDRIKSGVWGRCDPVDSGQSAVCGAGNFRAEIPGISDAERSDRHFLHLYLSSAHRNRIVSAWMAFRIPKRLPGHGKNGTADDFRCC